MPESKIKSGFYLFVAPFGVIVFVAFLILSRYLFKTCKACKNSRNDNNSEPVVNYTRGNSNSENSRSEKCPLCLKSVIWNHSHRLRCSSERAFHLSSMPKPCPTVRCTNCHEAMRLWPKQGPSFKCQDPNCSNAGKQLVNKGIYRFTCFLCDYNLCRPCVDKMLRNQGLIPHNWTLRQYLWSDNHYSVEDLERMIPQGAEDNPYSIIWGSGDSLPSAPSLIEENIYVEIPEERSNPPRYRELPPPSYEVATGLV